MKEEQRGNEEELQPTIQVKHLPLLLRPKQTCELFGIDLKALHKLETSGRVKAVRIGPKKVQRRYSPVSSNGHKETAELLIAKGADVNTRNDRA